MDDNPVAEILGVLKSKTRRQVIELLLLNPRGRRFSEISQTLKIYPSTLEKHLKKLVDSKMIAHFDHRYIATVRTMTLWEKFRNIEFAALDSYYQTHFLPIENQELRNEFGSLVFEVIPDLISIVNQINTDFSDSKGIIQAGGNLEYQIGKSIYSRGLLDHKNTRVEIILPKQVISQIENHDEENLFLEQFDAKKTWIYEIEECELGLGVDENSGFLFLPKLDSSPDYNQCLHTHSKKSIDWLQMTFNIMKSKSKVFTHNH